METFEIHITGDSKIISVCNDLLFKTIVIDLLRPDGSFFRTEYMTSLVKKFPDYKCCKEYVENLETLLSKNVVEIFRSKIESPFYQHYASQSCYVESHFDATDNLFPISRNQKKMSRMATDRRYNQDTYLAFREKYKDVTVELCLFDSNVQEDDDWFALYR